MQRKESSKSLAEHSTTWLLAVMPSEYLRAIFHRQKIQRRGLVAQLTASRPSASPPLSCQFPDFPKTGNGPGGAGGPVMILERILDSQSSNGQVGKANCKCTNREIITVKSISHLLDARGHDMRKMRLRKMITQCCIAHIDDAVRLSTQLIYIKICMRQRKLRQRKLRQRKSRPTLKVQTIKDGERVEVADAGD